MNNVSIFRTATNPDDVLEQAKGQLMDVVIIGWDHDGNLNARASQTITAKDILWMMEAFKLGLIEGRYSGD